MTTPTIGPNPAILTSGRFDRAYPDPQAVMQDAPRPLLETLAQPFLDDRHFASYAPKLLGSTDTGDVYCRLKAGALPVEMILLVFDVDGPDHTATAEWRAATAARLPAGALWYPTGGGLRIVFALPEPSPLASPEDCAAWSDFYAAACVAVERLWGVAPDVACSDWTRLYRLPKVTRDDMPTWCGDPLPVDWCPVPPLAWDDAWVTDADYLEAERRATAGGRARSAHSGAPTGDVEDTFLFRVLEEANWSFGDTNGEWTNIECPWADQHTTGGDWAGICGNDDEHADGPGVFNCHHSHCQGRTVKDVLAHPTFAPIVARMRAEKARESAALTEAFWAELDSRRAPALALPAAADTLATVDQDELLKNWGFQIARNKQGEVKNTPHNTLVTFAVHPSWHRVFAYDEFRREVIVQRDVTAAPFVRSAGHVFHADDDTTDIQAWFSYQLHAPSVDDVIRAVHTVAKRNTFHSVRQYLDSVRGKWDGADRNLVDYLGAEPTDYQRAACAKWLRSAVARAMKPGCKADTILILEGKQGARKSTAIKCLCPDVRWFYEAAGRNVGHKDFLQDMCGMWLCEIPEVDELIRSRDESELKAMLSRTSDRYRPSYARAAGIWPRQLVFAGTTNEEHYLKDATGNRRYNPVRCGVVGPIRDGGICDDRDQIWAQALAEYEAGQPWWFDAREDLLAVDEQEQRREQDPWSEMLDVWLAQRGAEPFTANEALAALPGAMTGAMLEQRHLNRMGKTLRAKGFICRDNTPHNKPRGRYWRHPSW